MSSEYTVSKQNKVRQLREKAAYDRDTVHEILDAGLVAHVGFVQDGAPVVVRSMISIWYSPALPASPSLVSMRR